MTSSIDQEILDYRQQRQQADLDSLLADLLKSRSLIETSTLAYVKQCQDFKQATLRFGLSNAHQYRVFYSLQLKTAAILTQSLDRSKRLDGLLSSVPIKPRVTKETPAYPVQSLLPVHDDLADLYGEGI
jgi:hypothetical protein